MRKLILFINIILCCSSVNLFAFADQTGTEKILRENKDFIDYINVGISNFDQSDKSLFFEIYQMHFNADLAYLQSDYMAAYRLIYNSQQKQNDYYADILEKYYLNDSKTMLDTLAPTVIKSKNQRARLYLSLGYRDRTVAQNFQAVGYATKPRLYSYKINKYLESVKLCRRSMRYALLALYESQTIETKQRIFNHLFEMERQEKNKFYNRFLSKTEKDVVSEIDKSYDEYSKENVKTEEVKPDSDAFETSEQKRSRFRDEKRAAEYLISGDFDNTEAIARKYVDDFSYKIILAMLEVMAAKPKSNEVETVDSAVSTQGNNLDFSFDYQFFKNHHIDNYERFIATSAIDGFTKQLKVVPLTKKTLPEESSKETEVSDKASTITDSAPVKDEKAVSTPVENKTETKPQ